MQIRQIPIFRDNYSYLIIDPSSGCAALVDPADPSAIQKILKAEGVQLTHILTTHHHPDHSAGNAAFAKVFPGLVVVGSAKEASKIPAITQEVSQGDVIKIGALEGRVIETPCHTLGHIAFLFDDALFCGDTLFVGGCGRFFEGDAAQMHNTLNVTLAELPDETRVFCGHEYTLSNLRFALHADPENAATKKKLQWALARRERYSEGQQVEGLPTVPSTLGEERAYNPFMRVHTPVIQAFTGTADPVKVMRILREKKNDFKG